MILVFVRQTIIVLIIVTSSLLKKDIFARLGLASAQNVFGGLLFPAVLESAECVNVQIFSISSFIFWVAQFTLVALPFCSPITQMKPRFGPRLMKRLYNSSGGGGVFIDYKYTVQHLVKVQVKSFHGSSYLFS